MNDVQKNLKKQMSQGINELKKKNKGGYYDYLRRNHLINSRKNELLSIYYKFNIRHN